jgi:hypothetical protein
VFWIIAAVVVVVLLALAWWSSGRASGRRPFANPSQHDESAQFQAVVVHRNTGGFGGPVG